MERCFLILALGLQLSFSGVAQVTSSQPGQQQTKPAPTNQREPIRPSEEDTVRITTNLVQVDAVVTDSHGKLVTDLRPEELQISEDGKPQTITNLSYISIEPGDGSEASQPAKQVDKNLPIGPPVRLRPDQIHRTVALVADDLGLSFESTFAVRLALKKFVDQQMQPNDLVAVIRTGGGIGALQQFTTDKRQLYAAIEKVKWNPTGRGGVSAFAPISNDPFNTPTRDTDDSRDHDRDDSSRDVAKRDAIDDFRQDLFAVGTLGAVNYIVRGLRELPGRKSVILFSEGLRIFNPSDPLGTLRVLAALKRLTDLANRASVVVYTIDARGLQYLGMSAADSSSGMTPGQVEASLSKRRSDFFESQDALNYLALQTGGFAIRNNNDLNGGIKRVLDDQQGYYLIGYRPDESTFDEISGRRKFHKLSLKVTRPGKFKVRMRNGFFGFTDEEARPTNLTIAQQLIGALTSPFGSAGVQLRLTSLFANDEKAGSVMRSMLHINGRDLTFSEEADGWHKAAFDILAVTFGDNGVVVDQIGRTHTLQLRGKQYERMLSDGLTYNIVVPVKKAGGYQLRAALRDSASSRIGSVSQFVEVPDVKKGRLTLSGLLVEGITQEVLQKSGGERKTQSETADDSINDSDPKAGPAVRQFKPGFVMLYDFVVYNAHLNQGTGKPQLQTQAKIFRDGKEIFTGKETAFDASSQTDLKRLASTGGIQLGSQMGVGEYVLQIIVTDLLRKDKYRVASQWIDFEVVK
jgi:VWFA-related protein